MVPPFDVLYSGNEFVRHLALSQDAGIKVNSPKFSKKQEYNGTNIRRLIVAGGQWKHLVPPAVAKAIEQVSGVERMKVLAGSDSNPQKW